MTEWILMKDKKPDDEQLCFITIYKSHDWNQETKESKYISRDKDEWYLGIGYYEIGPTDRDGSFEAPGYDLMWWGKEVIAWIPITMPDDIYRGEAEYD